MRIRFYFFALIASFCAHPISAKAAVSADQVTTIQSSIQDFLTYQKDVNEVTGNVIIDYEGELKAEAQGDYVALTLPHIKIKGKGENANIVDLGVITINAAPDAKPELWKMTITLPSAIKVSDSTASDFQVLLGQQDLKAVYNQTLGYFVRTDMTIMDITAAEDGKDLGFKFGKTIISSNLEEQTDKRLSGPFLLSFENFSGGDENSALRVAKFGVDAQINRLEALTLSAYKEIFMKHKATFATLTNTDEKSEEPSPQQSQAIADMIFDLYNFKLDGIETRLFVEGVNVETFAKEAAAEGEDAKENSSPADQNETFTLAKGSIGFGATKMESDAGNWMIDFGYSDASMTPVDPQYDGVFPKDMNVSLSAEKLPLVSLYSLTKNTVTSALSNPEMASIAGIGLLAKLPAILSQAGSELVIKDTSVNGGLYSTTLDGKIVTDLTAVTSFTGAFTGKFEGLDELIAKLRANEKLPDSYTPQEYADSAATLETIKSHGKAEGKLSGRSAYTYDIKFTPEGKFMVNEKDVELFPASPPPPAFDAMPAPDVESAPAP